MERNTLTTAGELQLNDRFYFVSDKKKIVYQVKAMNGKLVAYNCLNAWNYWKHTFDLTTGYPKEVIFLRHGEPIDVSTN